MKQKVEFINLEEDDKDLIISFAIYDEELGIKSLILLRTLFFEEFLEEGEKGVKVSLEGDYFEQEDFNTLIDIRVSDNEIKIKSFFREYQLDISKIDKSEIDGMMKLLKKQNYDDRFDIHVT